MTRRMFILIILGFLVLANSALANTQRTSQARITLDQSVHFMAADGSDVVIEPGRYQIEAAEEWLRVIPGERRDALLLQAQAIAHEEMITAPLVRLIIEDEDQYSLVLLLPNGKALETTGSVSGVRSRALKRSRVARPPAPRRKVTRIPSQTQQRAKLKKASPTRRQPLQQRQSGAPASTNTPEQTIQALEQRIQTLEQQMSSLLSIIQVTQGGAIIQAQNLSLQGQSLNIASDTNITINAALNLSAQSGMDLNLKGGLNAKIEGGGNITLKGGGVAKIEGGSQLKLKGPIVYLGSGSGMKPLAVVGSMTMTAPGGGPGTVTTGSATVFAK